MITEQLEVERIIWRFNWASALVSGGAIAGLLLIALGSGGMRPCVNAFGADQFGRGAREEKASSRFFSLFYFAVNIGALFSIFITPILRGAHRAPSQRTLTEVSYC